MATKTLESKVSSIDRAINSRSKIEIRELYGLANLEVNHALSCNRCTPSDMLDQLAKLKYSSETSLIKIGVANNPNTSGDTFDWLARDTIANKRLDPINADYVIYGIAKSGNTLPQTLDFIANAVKKEKESYSTKAVIASRNNVLIGTMLVLAMDESPYVRLAVANNNERTTSRILEQMILDGTRVREQDRDVRKAVLRNKNVGFRVVRELTFDPNDDVKKLALYTLGLVDLFELK